jgi:hypothetical protein
MRKLNDITASQSIRLAKEAFVSIINSSIQYNPDFKTTLNDLVLKFSEKYEGEENEESDIVGIGRTIYISEISDRRLSEAMERVAIAMDGNSYPTTVQIYDGLQKEIEEFDFSFLTEVALDIGGGLYDGGVALTDTVTDVGSGLVDTIIATAKNLKWIMLALAIFILYFLNKNSKQIIDKVPSV